MGCYLSLTDFQLTRFLRRYGRKAIVLTLILYVTSLIFYEYEGLYSSLHSMFIITEVISVMYLFQKLSVTSAGNCMNQLKGYTFFIYVFHGFVVSYLCKLMDKLFRIFGEPGYIFSYLLSPVVVTCLCVLLYKLLIAKIPQIMKLLGCR